jgi:RNA polymerase sigma-70 factor (ECF subfamily)
VSAAGAAERAARESYGRLVALLAYQWRDLAAAEDALADAFAAALVHWPRDGVPAKPDAWLLTAARRRLLEQARHLRVTQDPAVLALFDEEQQAPAPEPVPDARLKLLFVCAHPALPAQVHAPLMLQAVLGVEAKTIAEALLVSPATMAQRLVRAKQKIREAGLRFEEPEPRELPGRLAGVLESIYGAYTIGANTALLGPDAAQPEARSLLREEALFLARLVTALLPQQAEALGLLALLLYCEARRPAQFDDAGAFVPLTQQDTARWDRDLLSQAENALLQASTLRMPGAFQIEAAIQSAHCQRAFTGSTPWRAIAQLYAALIHLAPSIGARIGHAVAQAEAGDGALALAALDALGHDEAAALATHQPYWVARAHLCRLNGRAAEAEAALLRAIGLTEDARIRDHLQRMLTTGARATGGPQ